MPNWESKGMIDTARDEGRIEGEKQGRIEGEKQGKLEVALKGVQMGMTDEQISSLTGLEKSEIQKLRNGF
jgi:predicted transposase/invertase (TIGR01784 family)